MTVQPESQTETTIRNQAAASDEDKTIYSNEQQSTNHGQALETMKAEVNIPEAVRPSLGQFNSEAFQPINPGFIKPQTVKLETESPKSPSAIVLKPDYSLDPKKGSEELRAPNSEPQSPKTSNDNAARILENMRLNRTEVNSSDFMTSSGSMDANPQTSNYQSFSIKRADGTSVSLISNDDNKTPSQQSIHSVVVTDTQPNINSARLLQSQDQQRFSSPVFSIASQKPQNKSLPPPVQPASLLSENRADIPGLNLTAIQPVHLKKMQHPRPPPIYIPKPGQAPGMPTLINTAHSFQPQFSPNGYSAIPYTFGCYPHQTPFTQYYSISPPNSATSAGSATSATTSQPATPSYSYPFSSREGTIPYASANGCTVHPSIPGATILLPNGNWPQVYPGYMAPPYPIPPKKHAPGSYAPQMDMKMNDKKYSMGMHKSHMFMRSRKRSRQDLDDDIKCQQCGTRSTPEWRRGPNGFRTLCNACGLYHAKMARKKGEDEASRLLRKRPQATNN